MLAIFSLFASGNKKKMMTRTRTRLEDFFSLSLTVGQEHGEH